MDYVNLGKKDTMSSGANWMLADWVGPEEECREFVKLATYSVSDQALKDSSTINS